jgi:hypothetical protein
MAIVTRLIEKAEKMLDYNMTIRKADYGGRPQPHGEHRKLLKRPLESMKNQLGHPRPRLQPGCQESPARSKRPEPCTASFLSRLQRRTPRARTCARKGRKRAETVIAIGLFFNDPATKETRARKCSSQVARGDVAELPQVLDYIRKWFAHRFRHSFHRGIADDRSNLPTCERHANIFKGAGIHQRPRQCPGFWSGYFSAEQNVLRIKQSSLSRPECRPTATLTKETAARRNHEERARSKVFAI